MSSPEKELRQKAKKKQEEPGKWGVMEAKGWFLGEGSDRPCQMQPESPDYTKAEQ